MSRSLLPHEPRRVYSFARELRVPGREPEHEMLRDMREAWARAKVVPYQPPIMVVSPSQYARLLDIAAQLGTAPVFRDSDFGWRP